MEDPASHSNASAEPAPPASPELLPAEIRAARERFVALWGQMGTSWGIPRTMAQVHALLFISGTAMCTDDVMEQLGISRGNASQTLRGLVDWGIVSRVHRRGDRKEYFLAEQDVWKMFRTILAERKKREFDPLLIELGACRQPQDGAPRVDPAASSIEAHNARIDGLLEVMRLADSITRRFSGPAGKGLELAARLLDRAS